MDGARVHPERDVKPGETAHVRLRFRLPAEDGRYQVLLSPMRENVCWYYEQGWPFLLVETLHRERRGARGPGARGHARDARRASAPCARSAARSRYPVSTIWRNRGLIRVMVRRDILGRYRGSFGGAFWTIINPLLLMLTYFFVFGVVLRDAFSEGDPSRAGASRSTSWPACCRGWPSAKPSGARRA